MLTVLLVIAVAVAFALVLAGATWVGARRLSRGTIELDQRLTAEEAATGTCGGCKGSGRTPRAGGRFATEGPCWRCDGTGLPPTAEDRLRFMP